MIRTPALGAALLAGLAFACSGGDAGDGGPADDPALEQVPSAEEADAAAAAEIDAENLDDKIAEMEAELDG
jgi:hypothetical protein